MGAQQSQDNATEPNDQESRNKASQISTNTDAKKNHATTEASLPTQNSQDVPKLADATVLDKSPTKKPLHQQNQNRKMPECQIVPARDLAITWGEDNRYWHWPFLKESSDEAVTVAELLNVCWLEVHGRLDTARLPPGVMYQVLFVMKLNDPAYGWEDPVNLRLTLPGERKQEHKENMMEKPRGKWIEIPAGMFETTAENIGEIEFSMYEYEGGKWKRGLLIKGVRFEPMAPFV